MRTVFLGDFVLDSFNKAYRDEDKMYSKYIRLICSNFYYDDFNTLYQYSKVHINKTTGLKPNYMSSLLLCAVFLLLCIILNNSKDLNLHNEIFKIFAFYIFENMYQLTFFFYIFIYVSAYIFLGAALTKILRVEF